MPAWPEQTAQTENDEGLPPLPPAPPAANPGTTGVTTGATASGGTPPDDDGGGDAGETGGTPVTDLGAVADPSSSQLRIWRVLADPEGKDGAPGNPEFVVVHNTGPGPASLIDVRVEATSWSSLQLDDGALGFTSLDKAQSLVIFRFSDPTPAPMTLDPSMSITTSSGLRNADGHVALVDASGEVVDLLVYGAASAEPHTAGWSGPPAPDPGADEALCRTDASAWAASAWTICPPSPEGVVATEVGPLRIVEVLAGGPGDLDDENIHEFIELVNTTSNDVELSSWRLEVDGGVEDIELIAGPGGCTPEPCLAANARMLVVHDLFADPSGGAGLAITSDGRLGSTGLDDTAQIRVLRPDGQVASSHRVWPDPTVDPRPGAVGQSLHRTAPDAPDSPQAWSMAAPSPAH